MNEARSSWPETRPVMHVILVVGGIALALWLLVQLRSLILLLILSVFFAYLVAPIVAVFMRPVALRGRGFALSRGPAIGVVYLVLVGVIAIGALAVVPRISQEATQLAGQSPAILKMIEDRGQSMTALLDRVGLPPAVKQSVQAGFATLVGSIQAAGKRVAFTILDLAGYVPWLVLIPILAFFLLKDAEVISEGAVGMLPRGRARGFAERLFERVNVVLAAYIRAQLLACVIVGAVASLGFAVLGVPYAAVLGAAAGMAEFVPLAGPLIVAIVAALMAAFHMPILALWVLIFLGVMRIAQDYVVYPRLVSRGMHLHPLAIIVAILAGAELGGVAGIFLAVPALAVIIACYQEYRATAANVIE